MNVSKELKGNREFTTVILMQKVFASEQLWRGKEVTIETAVGPFSCLLVGLFCAVRA